MPFPLIALLEAAILASSLSIDAFTTSFAYGSNKTKIPMSSVHIINLICSLITGLSLFAGSKLKPYLPDWLMLTISISILFLIGGIKLLDSITKAWIQRHRDWRRIICLTILGFHIRIHLQPDQEVLLMDENASPTIKPMEATFLALSLSLDGMAVGFGAAFLHVNGLAVFLWSLVTNAVAILLGCHIGNRIARKVPFNLSWLSGVVLIGLAFSKFI